MTPAAGESPSRVLELIGFYRRTHYQVAFADGSEATIHVGQAPPFAIATWIGADRCAAFLSACNPYSNPLEDAGNAELMARLRHRLDARNARYLPGCGVLADEQWSEPSVLVAGLALPEVDALARTFGQNAIVLVDRERAARLRIYRDDWRDALVDVPDIVVAPAPLPSGGGLG